MAPLRRDLRPAALNLIRAANELLQEETTILASSEECDYFRTIYRSSREASAQRHCQITKDEEVTKTWKKSLEDPRNAKPVNENSRPKGDQLGSVALGPNQSSLAQGAIHPSKEPTSDSSTGGSCKHLNRSCPAGSRTAPAELGSHSCGTAPKHPCCQARTAIVASISSPGCGIYRNPKDFV